MSAGWVAATVRSRAMARRRLGPVAARALAASGSLSRALEILAASPYGQRDRSADPAVAAHGIAATLLWNLRVLAGWQPPPGAEALRRLAGWFEIANLDEHLQALRDEPTEPPFQLGTLATAWPRLAATGTRDELRVALTASPWGDPGGTAPREVQLAMRTRWAERVADGVVSAGPWAAGATALLVASEQLASGRPLPAAAAATARRIIGRAAVAATSLAELYAALPRAARWALEGTTDTADLWTAEVRWWRRVGIDGAKMLGGSGYGPDRTVGAAALLAADARLTRAALECAAHPDGDLAVFDAVA
jgi:hypothetical protein